MKKIFLAIGFICSLSLTALSVVAQQTRQDMVREIEAKRVELAALEKRFLAPSEEDKARYADFLRQRDTGLIRLLPREKSESDPSNDQQRGISTIRGGGAYYSFSRLSHQYGNGTDIEFSQGSLSTGFSGANYGILGSLGDTDLENVTLETPAVKFLYLHGPALDEPRARIEQARWTKGDTIEGTRFASRLPLRLGTTYVLRSIDFSSSDVLVAFRVMHGDVDDTVIILWKILARYPVPHLAPLRLH